MNWSGTTAMLMCLVSGVAVWPQERRDPGPARLHGTVTGADSGRPIPDALVEVTPESPDSGLALHARTDAEGSFEFREVLPGTYVVRASATRYLTLGYKQRDPDDAPVPIAIREGQRMEVALSLPRLSAVNGRVIDPYGDPVPGVGIFVFKETEVEGTRSLVAGGRSISPRLTDDLGQFRIDGLTPGVYYLGALSGALTASPLFLYPNDAAGFLPTYFPGTSRVDEAQPVRVGAGGSIEDIVLPLIPGPMARVSGVVVDSTGLPHARALISITPAGRSGARIALAARAQAAEDGTFTFAGVAPGEYVVQGRSLGTVDAFTGEYGWSTVLVPDAGLTNVRVATTTPSSVSGRMVYSGEASLPMKDHFSLEITAPPADLATEPVIPISTRPAPVDLGSDGGFTIKQLWGRRFIRVSSRTGWIVERIVSAGKDVTDAPIEFAGQQLSAVEIVLTRSSASVSGRVLGDDRRPTGNCRVVLFAADPARWMPHSRFVGSASVESNGEFTIGGLPPEQYLAIAVPRRAVAPTAAAFLEQYRTRATPIALPEGLTRGLELTCLRD
jgi:Carboxypeptidase regulatory-like domain